MKTISIRLYFYSWDIDDKKSNSALYVTEKERDNALTILRANKLLDGITFKKESTELFITDLYAIANEFDSDIVNRFI